MKTDLSTFDWVSLSALGTLLAVAVALFYPVLRERWKMGMYIFICQNSFLDGLSRQEVEGAATISSHDSKDSSRHA